MQTANSFRGQAIGAAFFTGFGALWLLLATLAMGAWTPQRGVLIAAAASALFVGCVYLHRQGRRWPCVAEDPERARVFGRVNLAQWLAIGIVAPTLGHFHLDAYICPAITAIVGVHLFPLARLFRRPQHLVNGIVLTLRASFTVLAVPLDKLQAVSSLGTGLILWTSAAISLAASIAASRSRQPLLQSSGQAA